MQKTLAAFVEADKKHKKYLNRQISERKALIGLQVRKF